LQIGDSGEWYHIKLICQYLIYYQLVIKYFAYKLKKIPFQFKNVFQKVVIVSSDNQNQLLGKFIIPCLANQKRQSPNGSAFNSEASQNAVVFSGTAILFMRLIRPAKKMHAHLRSHKKWCDIMSF